MAEEQAILLMGHIVSECHYRQATYGQISPVTYRNRHYRQAINGQAIGSADITAATYHGYAMSFSL
jgi:hypothetical protein